MQEIDKPNSSRTNDVLNDRVLEPFNYIRKRNIEKRILMVDDDIFNQMA